MNRKIRTVHRMLLPTSGPAVDTKRGFIVINKVYARDCRPGKPNWCHVVVTRRMGNVIYEAAAEDEKWLRNNNRLRNWCTSQDRNHTKFQIPLGIFYLPAITSANGEPSI